MVCSEWRQAMPNSSISPLRLRLAVGVCLSAIGKHLSGEGLTTGAVYLAPVAGDRLSVQRQFHNRGRLCT